MSTIKIARQESLANDIAALGTFSRDFSGLEKYTRISVFVKGNTILVGNYDIALLISDDGTNFADISVGETTISTDIQVVHNIPVDHVANHVRVAITRNAAATGTIDINLVAQLMI